MLDPDLLALLISFISSQLLLDFFVLEVLVHPLKDLLAAIHVTLDSFLVHNHSHFAVWQMIQVIPYLRLVCICVAHRPLRILLNVGKLLSGHNVVEHQRIRCFQILEFFRAFHHKA